MAGRRVRTGKRRICWSLGISTVGKAADAVHAEFQRRIFFAHVLECRSTGMPDSG